VPLARRRRSSSATLDRTESHDVREVNEPRTRRTSTLHRHHHLQSGSHHLQLPNLRTPEPPHSISGTGARRTAPPPRCEHREGGRDVVGIRRTPPPEKISATTNHQIDSAILSPAPPIGHSLTPSYVQTRSVVPPPSRRQSGGGTGESPPANWSERVGEKNRLSYCSGGESRAKFRARR
jgi:hypothetical protein